MNGKKLYKSKDNVKISGVCAGIAEYCNIDPTLVRLLWAVITIFSAFVAGVLAYIVCACVIPERPDGDTYVVDEDNDNN